MTIGTSPFAVDPQDRRAAGVTCTADEGARVSIARALLVLAILASSYLFWCARDAPAVGVFGDDGFYLTAAQSIVEGRGYRMPSLPGAPYQTKYPPLYPLLLSVVWKIAPVWPSNVPYFMLLSCLIWAGPAGQVRTGSRPTIRRWSTTRITCGSGGSILRLL